MSGHVEGAVEKFEKAKWVPRTRPGLSSLERGASFGISQLCGLPDMATIAKSVRGSLTVTGNIN
jgi:hypothetical protein